MDTTKQGTSESGGNRDGGKRFRTVAEKRQIVEETLVPGVSVARVARSHGVNANQVFSWRKLYQGGRLGEGGAAKLLPVRICESPPAMAAPVGECSVKRPLAGAIHIEWRRAKMRIEGGVEPELLRVLLEYLRP